MRAPDISIVIPVYKEESYLKPCLRDLSQQTIIYRCEIILVEYNPERTPWARDILRDFHELRPDIPTRLIEVFEKGIKVARHEGILYAKGEIICDFDADARWSEIDGLERMTEPLFNRQAVMTNCDNIIDVSQLSEYQMRDHNIAATIPVMNFFNSVQRLTNFSIGDPGTLFLKTVYEEAGGFDLKTAEGWETANLTPRIMWLYPGMIKNIKDVKVLQSPRRMLKVTKNPEVFGHYDKAIRGDEILALFGRRVL
jgi:glycosyltransferase involved in cell wall biosynthesis